MLLEVKKNSVKEHHAENDEEGEDNLSSFVKPKKKKPLKKKDDKVDENNLGCSNKEKQQQQQQQQQMKKKKKKTSNKGEKCSCFVIEGEEDIGIGGESKQLLGKQMERRRCLICLVKSVTRPPEQRDPLRIFYETLYHQQLPHTELAAIWMMDRVWFAPQRSGRDSTFMIEKKQMKKKQLAEAQLGNKSCCNGEEN